MKHDSDKQIKLGLILSYINLGIGNLIPFFYTPIMLELLGQAEYGLYKIAGSTTSYLSLITFGFGSAVSRFIIKAKTQDGKLAEERMFGLFHLIFQTLSFLTLIIGGIIAFNLDAIYGTSLTPAEISRMQILVGLMVINTAVSFSATSYNAIVSAHERFLFIHSVNVLSTIGTPVVNLVVLFLGYRSVGMAMVSLALNVVLRVAYLFYVRKVLDIRPRYDKLPTNSLREILKFSLWVFVGSIAGQLYDATDTVIIGATPSLAAAGAAIYNVGITFPHIISSLGQAISALYIPRANAQVFSGASDAQLTDMVINIGRMQSYIVALVVSGFIAFGQPFIAWYAGTEYALSYWIAIIIIIPNCIPLLQSVALSILSAKNMHRFRSILYLGIAFVNFIATLILIRPFGLIGASIPTGLALLIGNGVILNWYYWKRVGINIPLFWKKLFPILTLSIVICAVTLWISNIVNFYNPTILILGILVYSVIYCITVWRFIMYKEEKAAILSLFERNTG